MRGEGEKKEQETSREYPYCYCRICKVKLHVYATHCWKCGEKTEQLIYRSKDKEDELYSKNLNSVEKCMRCFNVLQRNAACEVIICFGTGRGSCEYCRRTEGTRFECCQQAQKDKPTKSLSEALKELMQGKSPGPMAKTLTEAFAHQQFEDDIPF